MDTQTSHFITGDPAFAVNRKGVIVMWNEAAEECLGVERSAAMGKKCWNLLAGKDVNGNRQCCEHCLIREQAFQHVPVHGFDSTIKAGFDEPEKFGFSCVIVPDESGHEILLHICNPKHDTPSPASEKFSVTHPSESLSCRELEVLNLLADGLRTKDIAERLSISIRTVRTHIQHLMYKLQVHKRAQAIRTAKNLGLI